MKTWPQFVFFTITNCLLSLIDASHKLWIHVSVRLLTMKISQWVCKNFCSYHKKIIFLLLTDQINLYISPYHVNSKQCTSKTYHSESMCCKEVETRCIYKDIKRRILVFSDTFKFLPVLFHPFTHFCNAKGSDFMPGISETKKECQPTCIFVAQLTILKNHIYISVFI